MSKLTCLKCHFELTVGAKFCSNCGVRVNMTGSGSGEGQQKNNAERRHLTVLFSDLVDSTPLSEQLDPEEMRDVLSVYQSVCTSLVKRYGGYVAKYLGDGVLAYFGYPKAHEDDARRGVSAGIGIVEAMQNHSEKFQDLYNIETKVRVGIHTGLVVVGDMGGSEELESHAIVGKTPNLAARIQSYADVNTVLLSNDTFKLVQGYFECVNLGSHRLKGISEPVFLHKALKEITARERLESRGKDLIAFTGRINEMQSLRDSWAKSKSGEGQVVIINGEAGVGKSRVVMSMKETALKEKNTWLTEVRCSQYYINSSFYPIIDMIERIVMKFSGDEDQNEKLERIEGWASQYGMEELTTVPLLAALLSIPVSKKYEELNLTPIKQKERTIDLLVSVLLERAKEQPVLFIVEDLHWADPSTLELLDKFFEAGENSHILTMFTHRPEFSHIWKERSGLTMMNLSRLPIKDSKEIIHKAANGKNIPLEVENYILEKTDGIPLFLEELTKMMVDTEMLKENSGAFELVAPLHTLPVPATLQESLSARLDKMKDAKPVAQLCAAVGREFSFEMIDSIPGPHREQLSNHLNQLVESGLLFQDGSPPNSQYIFKHALIQDSAYKSLLRSSRRQYHQAIADSFESSRPELHDAQPELIAHHFTEAGSSLQAMTYWQKAGQLALEKSAMPEAISHLIKAVEESSKLPDGPDRMGGELMAQTYLGLANMQSWGYGHPDVEKAFSRARDLCKLMGDPPQIFPVLHGLVKFRLVRGEYQYGLELARQLQQTAEEADDKDLLIEALYPVGAAQFWMGDPDSSIPNLERLISLYDPVAHRNHGWIYGEDPCVVAYGHNHWQRVIGGMFGASQEDLKNADKLIKDLNHPWTTDYFHVCRVRMYAALRDYEQTLKASEDFRESALEHGFPWWVAAASIVVGWSMANLGNVEEGLKIASENTEIWRMMGAELATPSFYMRVAEIHLLDGNPAKALEVLNKSLSIIEKTHEGLYEAEIHRVKGIAISILGDKEKALKEISLAIEISMNRNQRLWLVRAATSHVRLCLQMGRETAELKTLEQIFKWFKEGHNLPDLVEANELLKELGKL